MLRRTATAKDSWGYWYMRALKDKILDEEPIVFSEDTRAKLEEWFTEDAVIIKKYEKYYKEDYPGASNLDLYKFLIELLSDPDNYPDA